MLEKKIAALKNMSKEELVGEFEVKIHPPSGWLLFFGHSPIFSSHT